MGNIVLMDVLEKIIESVLTILVSICIYLIIKAILDHRAKKLKKGKRLTYLRLLRSACKYILIVLDFLTILQICGIDTVSIVAGLGILSVIIGLALQDALKDIITGFNIITDDFFAVGDVVEVNGIVGKVLEIGIKSVRLKNLITGNVEVISNRNIGSSTIVSEQFDIDLPLPYEKSLNKIETLLTQIVDNIKNVPGVLDAKYCGINEYGESAIIYKIRLNVKTERRFQIGRDVRCLIKQQLDESKVSIPYNQVDIHLEQKK